MACKLKKPGFVTISEFARLIGVSQPAVSQAVQNGRLQVYSEGGKRVQPGYPVQKWLKLAEARRDWDENRVRFDNDWLCRED
jgi:hypothetical protein